MAQSFKDLAGKMPKGGGAVGAGLKFLATLGAVGYGLSQSVYTGKFFVSFSLSI